jgi:type II secretory pathway pseudopilin PulG
VLDAIRIAGRATTGAEAQRPGDVTGLPAELQREDVTGLAGERQGEDMTGLAGERHGEDLTVLPVRRLRSQAVLAPPPAAPAATLAPAEAPPASPPDDRRSRPLGIIVAAVVVALLAGSLIGYLVGHSTGSDSSTAPSVPASPGSTVSPSAVTSASPADVGALRTQLATAVRHAAGLEAQVKTLTGQVQDAQVQATALQAQLQSAQAQLQSAQGQLQSAQAQLSVVSAALPVNLSALDVSGSYAAGATNVESCAGFNDDCTTFLTRYSFQAVPDPGSPGNFLISSYYFANKPLTRYGTTFVSQGSVDRGTAMCDGSAQATSYSLTLVPQSVALAGGTVVVSTVVGDLTYASPAGGGCRDASARVAFTATRG